MRTVKLNGVIVIRTESRREGLVSWFGRGAQQQFYSSDMDIEALRGVVTGSTDDEFAGKLKLPLQVIAACYRYAEVRDFAPPVEPSFPGGPTSVPWPSRDARQKAMEILNDDL